MTEPRLTSAGGLSNGTEKLSVTCGEDKTGTQQSVRPFASTKGGVVSWGKGDDDDDDDDDDDGFSNFFCRDSYLRPRVNDGGDLLS